MESHHSAHDLDSYCMQHMGLVWGMCCPTKGTHCIWCTGPIQEMCCMWCLHWTGLIHWIQHVRPSLWAQFSLETAPALLIQLNLFKNNLYPLVPDQDHKQKLFLSYHRYHKMTILHVLFSANSWKIKVRKWLEILESHIIFEVNKMFN